MPPSSSSPEGSPAPRGRRHSTPASKKKAAKKEPAFAKLCSLCRFHTPGDWALVFLGLVGSIINGATMPVFSIFFGNVVDSLGLPGGAAKAPRAALSFVYLGLVAAAAAALEGWSWRAAAARAAARLRSAAFEAALYKDAAWHESGGGESLGGGGGGDGANSAVATSGGSGAKPSSGGGSGGAGATPAAVAAALDEGGEGMITVWGDALPRLVHQAAKFGAGLGIALYRGWDVTLVLMSVTPLMALANALSAPAIRRAAAARARFDSLPAAAAAEALQGVRTVYVSGTQSRTVASVDSLCELSVGPGTALGWLRGLSQGATSALFLAGYSLSLWYGGGVAVASGKRSGGDVVNALFAAMSAGLALSQAVPAGQALALGRAAAGRLLAVIDRDPPSPRGGFVLPEVQGAIELRDVTFRYPEAARKAAEAAAAAAAAGTTGGSIPASIAPPPVLDALSLSIPARWSVALVGGSGCGKSTVLQLLQRVHSPQRGRVLLDGQSVSSLDLDWYRRQFAVVGQDPVIFSLTVAQNIRMGRPDASDAEVAAAAQAAGASAFVEALPRGYDTQLADRGADLSGGQRARLAIARAILRSDARVLLLDEASAALDAAGEAALRGALEAAAADRTTVMVAHRLSSIVNADKIFVLSGGRVAQEGTHAELSADEGGEYCRLVALQASRPADADLIREDQFEEEEEDEESKRKKKKAKAKGRATRSGSVFQRMHAAVLRGNRRRRKKKGDGNGNPGDDDCDDDDDDSKKQRPVFLPLARLLSTPQDLRDALLSSLGACAAGAQNPVFALCISSVIGAFYQPTPALVRKEVRTWCGVFGALACAALCSNSLALGCSGALAARLARRLRSSALEGFLAQDVAWHDQEARSAAALARVLSTDVGAIRDAVAEAAPALPQAAVALGVSVALALSADWRMALVVAAGLPALLAAGAAQGSAAGAASRGVAAAAAAPASVAAQCLRGIKAVQAFGLEADSAAAFEATQRRVTAAAARGAALGALAAAAAAFAQFAVFALAFWYGGRGVASGEMGLDAMMRVFFTVVLAATSLVDAQACLPSLARVRGAAERGALAPPGDGIDCIEGGGGEKGSGKDSDGGGSVALVATASTSTSSPPSSTGALALANVSFSYPSRPRVPIFRDFSLEIPAGKSTALTGGSGCGKSTVIGLLARFYDPLRGSVSLDGRNVKEIDLRWYRSQFALVSQEPVLFSGTVFDNIAYGMPHATLDDVRAAAMAANALGFIQDLPDGFDTRVGSVALPPRKARNGDERRGALPSSSSSSTAPLSGGQRQRIVIARAFLKSPRILLLDEATSALDAHSEHKITQALSALLQGRTSVVVAHRLQTVKRADAIAVVSGGRVAERGTHEELVAAKGIYAGLVSSSLI